MSGAPEQDAEVIIAIYDPVRDKLTTHRGYNVKEMDKHYRSVLLLKNRYGDGDIAIGCAFYGKCGIWRELPKSNEIYNYEVYNKISDYNTEALINTTSDGEICTDTKINKLEIKF